MSLGADMRRAEAHLGRCLEEDGRAARELLAETSGPPATPADNRRAFGLWQAITREQLAVRGAVRRRFG